jgi:phage gpG-like protein
MVMQIRISVFGDDVLARDLLRMKDRAMDMRPAFEAIHESFKTVEDWQFGTQGGVHKWAPLAASTVAYKARLGLDPRILHATLRLRKSLTETANADHIFEATRDTVVMGSRVPYGIFHQSTRPRRRLPRRPPVDLSETAKREWVKILQRYLTTGELV